MKNLIVILAIWSPVIALFIIEYWQVIIAMSGIIGAAWAVLWPEEEKKEYVYVCQEKGIEKIEQA